MVHQTSDEKTGWWSELWRRQRWMILILWIVAGIRFALDFRQADDPIAFETGAIRWQATIGVYYVSGALLLIASFRGTYRGLSYGRHVLGMVMLGLLCWGVPNSIVYTTAQFQGWEHGRFTPPPAEGVEVPEGTARERSGPIAETALGKVASGVGVGAGTTVASFVLWNFWLMNLLIYLPARLRRRTGEST